MSNTGQRYVPLNGPEIKRIAMARLQAILDADSRLAFHLVYHQVAVSVGVRITSYPMDKGPIEHAFSEVIGDAPAGHADLVPPVPQVEAVGDQTDGNLVRDMRDVSRDPRGVRDMRNSSTTPGVRSYSAGPAPKKPGNGQPAATPRRGVSEAVQEAVRSTEARRLEAARQASGQRKIGAPVPDPNDTSIDPRNLAIDGDHGNTVRGQVRTANGQGEVIEGGAAPLPPGIAAVTHERMASERAEVEAFNLRQRLDNEAALKSESTVVHSPNTARRDHGLPVPTARASRGDAQNIVDAPETF